MKESNNSVSSEGDHKSSEGTGQRWITFDGGTGKEDGLSQLSHGKLLLKTCAG